MFLFLLPEHHFFFFFCKPIGRLGLQQSPVFSKCLGTPMKNDRLIKVEEMTVYFLWPTLWHIDIIALIPSLVYLCSCVRYDHILLYFKFNSFLIVLINAFTRNEVDKRTMLYLLRLMWLTWKSSFLHLRRYPSFVFQRTIFFSLWSPTLTAPPPFFFFLLLSFRATKRSCFSEKKTPSFCSCTTRSLLFHKLRFFHVPFIKANKPCYFNSCFKLISWFRPLHSAYLILRARNTLTLC